MILSEIDGNVSGVGMTSVLEHTLGNTVNQLVNTYSINEKILHDMRIWITSNNISDESETRALKNVNLSWSGLEAICDLRSSMEAYGTINKLDTVADTVADTHMAAMAAAVGG